MGDSKEWEKEKIYDRQLRLWGVKAQNRMMKSNVLIIGLSAINIEICKNLILNGINITIIDDNIVDEEMRENVFFLDESDNGKYVCLSIFKELKSINQLININAYIGRIDIVNDKIVLDKHLIYKEEGIDNKEINECFSINNFINNYTSVCISCEDYPLYKLININEICHKKNIGFFAPMCNGKFAFLFSDLGNHAIEESYYKTKKNIEENNKFTEIKYCRLSHFLKVSFQNFHKKTNHIIFYMFALILFEQHKEFNKSKKEIDEKEFYNFCNKYELNNDQTLKEISKMYKVTFSPSCSIMGGITAQEIRKFVSKQHESIPNFCVFDMNQNIACTAMIS
ncbi:ubiquitin activating enzyme (E1) subunit Aos1, putative [Plasmodium relictum]|uniref:Ubiquitin activating enzyme (E1) subunit Aos1, putative n=1 Tax=Plasmodium relictum TaxID=85471 RepID=A0A1J1H6C8_PLARL|nr:ubiquitin activating enzyme (E1) subunit Aos1, putative [Plasmodium relictum]CRH00316.1 ubiquitin activating enzyme (E1) subunit Aos1, putative [Plasmodium relictum]